MLGKQPVDELEIVGVGLSKTGTTSLAKALSVLGYNTIDCPFRWDSLAGHSAATDSPVAMWFRQGVLPNRVKVILTVRDVNDWLNSCERWWHLKPSINKQFHPALHQAREFFYGGQGFDREVFSQAYMDHSRAVMENRSCANLLVYHLCDGEGWEPLCSFLDKPIPSVEFPFLNAYTSIPSAHLQRPTLSCQAD